MVNRLETMFSLIWLGALSLFEGQRQAVMALNDLNHYIQPALGGSL